MADNQLKAIFISVFLLGNVVAFVHSLFAFLGGGGFAWFLAVVAAGAVLAVFFVHIGRGQRARTSRNLPRLLTVVTVLAVLSILFANHSTARIYTVLVSTAGVWAYVLWYSKLDRSASQLSVGAVLPALTFYSADNQVLNTAEIKAPLLLVFYRGNWCPLCTAQVQEVANQYQQLAERGYQVLMVSPQPHTQTAAIAARFQVPMIFCEDRDGAAARQLGILHERALPYGMEKMGYSADAVLPTVIITDASHTIRWLDETDNYRVRPEPKDFLNVIDELTINAAA